MAICVAGSGPEISPHPMPQQNSPRHPCRVADRPSAKSSHRFGRSIDIVDAGQFMNESALRFRRPPTRPLALRLQGVKAGMGTRSGVHSGSGRSPGVDGFIGIGG